MNKTQPRKAPNLELIFDPENPNCSGCYFGFTDECGKKKDEFFKNISCVFRGVDGKEHMGKFKFKKELKLDMERGEA